MTQKFDLDPEPGFDWGKVTWGHPDAIVSVVCSYCSAFIRDSEIPLMMWDREGRCAKFCEKCTKRWWGMKK
jgi:hypothetical protein